MRQRSFCTHSIARPFSQLKPAPSPRRKSALPKPTSMRALMVVCTGLLATDFTAGAATASVGASIATGVGVVACTVAADFAGATFLDAADLVAGVSELVDFDGFFFGALMYVETEVFYPVLCPTPSKSKANAPAAFARND